MHDAWKQPQDFEAPPLASLDASIARLPPYSRGPNIASTEEMMMGASFVEIQMQSGFSVVHSFRC